MYPAHRRRTRALLTLAVAILATCVGSVAPASAAQMKLLSRLDSGEVWTKTGQQGSDWVYQANNMVSALRYA